MKKYYLEDGSKILVDDTKPIGSGGEGSVFKLVKNANVLVKIYAERTLIRNPDIEQKIKAMVGKKPSLLDYKGLTIIAWPSYVIYDANKKFVGYLMRRVQAKNQLSHVITPGLQKTKFPSITWYDRLVIAINLSKVLSYLHQNDTVIGDINTSDFFVYPGFEIGVVDTDSFQVKVENDLYHCKVFTPDYTPPEVINEKKRTSKEVARKPNHDNYGLAILIFQILNMGVHPFSARIKGILGFDGNAINYNMEHEIFPYHSLNSNIIPPKNAMPFGFYPKHVQDFFIRAFEKGGVNRPTADEWVGALRDVKENIKKCKKHKHHFYPAHFQKCPLCARENTKDYDYLLDYFTTISRKYIRYETDHQPIVVDENYVYEELISGKTYTLKNSTRLAFFFHQRMLDKYHLSDRIKALKGDLVLQKLSKYVSKPIDLIMSKDVIIGYTTARMKHVFRLTHFLKSTHIGRHKITDKSKVLVAKNIAAMFHSFEKYQITVELNQIYLDKDLNPFIADVVFLPSADGHLRAMTFMKADYLPHEFYLHQTYVAYLEKLAEEARLIEEKRLQEIEEQRLKDLELIRSPLEPKLKIEKEAKIDLSTDTPKDGFEFEKSHHLFIDQTEEDQEEIPLEIKSFDFNSKASIRFHLAIIIHYLIQGAHPFKGVYKRTEHKPSFFIENNYYIHKLETPNADISSQAKPIELYPSYYQTIMKRALYVSNPLKIERPSSMEWQTVLMRLAFEYKQCLTSEIHYYHPSITKCPSCSLGERSDHLQTRGFIKDYKKGIMHHLLFTNQIFNYMVFSFMIVFMIYMVNSNIVQSFDDLFTLMRLADKWEIFKALIGLEGIIDFFSGLISNISGWLRLIFGGEA